MRSEIYQLRIFLNLDYKLILFAYIFGLINIAIVLPKLIYL